MKNPCEADRICVVYDHMANWSGVPSNGPGITSMMFVMPNSGRSKRAALTAFLLKRKLLEWIDLRCSRQSYSVFELEYKYKCAIRKNILYTSYSKYEILQRLQ